MTQIALASHRRRAGLALLLVFAATLAPFALAPGQVDAPQVQVASAT